MTPHEISQKLKELLYQIAPDADLDALKPDENIREKLDIDSFDYLQFIVQVDETFRIHTPEQDYGRIQTLNQLTHYIAEKILKA